MYRTVQSCQGEREWYIFYFFRNAASGLLERFKEWFNMNRIKNKSYILQYAQRFKKFINPKLKKGFNPDTVVKSSTLTGGAIADQFTKLIKLIVAERPKTTSTKYNQDL